MARLTSKPQPSRGRPEPASGGDTGARTQQVIQVATRCATIDEFVERFAAFAWESSLVLPAASALPVGTQGRFVILLKDQSIAMRGRCRVTEAKPTPVSSRNPAVKRVMMRVALLEMDDASRAVHKRLIALRSAPVPLPIPPEPSETTQIEPARHGISPASAVEIPASPAKTPPPAAVAPPPAAAAPPPAAAAPVPPVKAPPPAPPVSLNRTMIGVGIGPDGRAILPQPGPAAMPPAAAPATAAPAAPTPSPNVSALATAATMIMTPGAQSPLPGVTRTPTPPRVETRAPRAPETLPANPLSEFNADEVESFIECTLLEAELPPEAHAPDGPTSTDAPLAAAVAAVRRTTAYIRVQQLASKLPPHVQNRLLRVAPFAVVALLAFFVGRLIYKSAPASTTVARVAPAAPAAPAPAPVQAPVAATPAAELEAPPPAPAAPPPPAAKKVARPEKAPVAEAPAPPVEQPEPAERPTPAEKPARPVIAAGTPGSCTARVTTEPNDAKVLWDGKLIGRSPVDGARVPCGAAQVTIERERWQPVTLDVNMQAGDEVVVRQRLHRPHGTLVISSSPPGAQISLNHAGVGAAPKHLEAMRFEQVTIRATLKGYQPWTKKVYLREAETKIDIELTPKKR